jgi:hypothetical protein
VQWEAKKEQLPAAWSCEESKAAEAVHALEGEQAEDGARTDSAKSERTDSAKSESTDSAKSESTDSAKSESTDSTKSERTDSA